MPIDICKTKFYLAVCWHTKRGRCTCDEQGNWRRVWKGKSWWMEGLARNSARQVENLKAYNEFGVDQWAFSITMNYRATYIRNDFVLLLQPLGLTRRFWEGNKQEHLYLDYPSHSLWSAAKIFYLFRNHCLTILNQSLLTLIFSSILSLF